MWLYFSLGTLDETVFNLHVIGARVVSVSRILSRVYLRCLRRKRTNLMLINNQLNAQILVL